ncbi:MAG TPA: Na+/H+ antiporter NhaA [Gammaproteobacteria bacterium]|nr:Na+/H+ antiporter NhaA [Gammaproteobacteria bacterium]
MPLNPIKAFLKREAASGVFLFLAALTAIILDNSPAALFYQSLQKLTVNIQFSSWNPTISLVSGINEGLMTLFFLLVGLELKREFFMGTLVQVKQIILPGIAAAGGMIIPALIFMGINWTNSIGLQGWAIPVATDIAFALGVLSLFGRKVPVGLKLFLMTLAIFDDLGAIIIIAIFNTQNLSGIFFLASIVILASVWLLNYCNVTKLFPYLFLGFLLWFSLLKTGIHPTIAGVLLALFIPVRERSNPLQRLQNNLHGFVAYFVMPLFAFMNAGISFSGMKFSDLLDPVTAGIILGLFIGKQLGVFGFAFAMIKYSKASLPNNTSWVQLYGVSLLCGIGFTMSLFLGTLAFETHFPDYLTKVRLGVLTGSLLSGILGALVLHKKLKR